MLDYFLGVVWELKEEESTDVTFRYHVCSESGGNENNRHVAAD